MSEFITLFSPLTKLRPRVIIREIGVDSCKNITQDSAFYRLLTVYAMIERNMHENKPPMCERGCSECCSDYFEVTPVEFFHIANHIQERFTGETIRRMYRKIDMQMPSFTLRSDDSGDAQNPFPCVFIDDRGDKCRIYEARPLLCRLYGTYGNYRCGKVSGLLKSNREVDLLAEQLLNPLKVPAVPLVYWIRRFADNPQIQTLYAASKTQPFEVYLKIVTAQGFSFLDPTR